jgi:hypothetical protein
MNVLARNEWVKQSGMEKGGRRWQRGERLLWAENYIEIE